MAISDPVLSLMGRRRAEMLAVGGRKAVNAEQVRSEQKNFYSDVI